VGATQVVFEGVPTYPERRPLLGNHRAQGQHLLHRADRDPFADQGGRWDPKVHPKNYDLSSLRLLGTVGEPINPEAWMWYYTQVGGERCPIVDTFWQTETGGHMITPLPGATPLVPGSCTCRCRASWPPSSTRRARRAERQGGILVVKRPWPSMIRTIWNDPDRFKKSTSRKSWAARCIWPATARSATRTPATSPSPAVSTTC
jgi:acetyl-CoA synthetase